MRPFLVGLPIGVFDSGVGGLSVLREIRAALPLENLHYVADSGYAPYGDRSAAFIEARTHAIADFLTDLNVKAMVVACNTATGVAVGALRERTSMPVVAIEPAIKPAVSLTRTKVIGVLATRQTTASPSVSRLVAEHGHDARVILQPCPGLVEQVEIGALLEPKTRALLESYIHPLLEKGADTLVLGCTHYPFLLTLIRDIVGPTVTVLDPAPAVAQQLKRRLTEHNLIRKNLSDDGPKESSTGQTHFWTSGDPAHAAATMTALWGAPIQVHALPQRYCAAPTES